MARPFRDTLILATAALGTALAAVGGWRYARASAPASGPIVIVSIDSVRADHLPAYGSRHVRTPALDLLAADGVVFERAYSHAAETGPAHAALLSGRLPVETGGRDAGPAVRTGERLLAERLRDRGYATAAIVSSSWLGKATGLATGFELFDDQVAPPPPDGARTDTPVVFADAGPIERDGSESEALAERWLEKAGTSRALLFLHINEPHGPHTPPARFAEYAPYDGEIAYADEIVGRLVHYLKTHQLYDRSTIVIVSDHGEGLGTHGEQEHGLFLYTEHLHVPLIVKQEANAGAGRRVRDLVQLVDLMPTVLDLVKAPIPGGLPGRSLKPLLDGTGRLPARSVYAEALYAWNRFGWSGLASMTDGRYHYIRAPREELYDLERDPEERENLLATGLGVAAADDEARQARERLAADLDRITGGSASQAESGAGGGAGLVDPKDKWELVETYRDAVRLAAGSQWTPALDLLRRVVGADPELIGVWAHVAELASLLDRHEVALDAYESIVARKPEELPAWLGAAETLLGERRFVEAREWAATASEKAAASADTTSLADAHLLLARIAVARRDATAARREAELAGQADPALPVPAYIEARLLYEQGKYDEALPLFQEAVEALKKSARPIAGLHFHTGDTLERLKRHDEAEIELAEEIRLFPLSVRARAGLASVYHETGRQAAAAEAVDEMLRTTPTPESYALAARLWRSFGDARRAAAVRAEAQQLFARRAARR